MGACGKADSPTGPGGTPVAPPPATPVGSYTLQTIDAKAMPYTMYAEPDYTLQVASGTIAITTNGKWVSKFVTTETVAGNVSTYSDSTYGTWTVATGTTVAVFINSETSVTSNGSWTAIDVTVNDVDGATIRKIVYKKN
jgi:hypothetical protein